MLRKTLTLHISTETFVFSTKRDSFEDDDVSTIYFDTYDGDDFYTSIKIETIKDIELKDGIFLIKTSGDNITVSFLYIKKFNF